MLVRAPARRHAECGGTRRDARRPQRPPYRRRSRPGRFLLPHRIDGAAGRSGPRAGPGDDPHQRRFLRVPPGDGAAGANRAQAIVEHPDHAALFDRLRRWNARPGHRTVYTVGNHDSETGWNGAIAAYLIAQGIVHTVALGYEHCFTAGGHELTVYAEHGNEEDSQNAIVDYGHPLIVPMGTYVVTQLVNRDRAARPVRRAGRRDDALGHRQHLPAGDGAVVALLELLLPPGAALHAVRRAARHRDPLRPALPE